MKDLKKNRETGKYTELNQLQLNSKLVKKLMDDYYIAAKESNLEDLQFGYNILNLTENLSDWLKKIDENKKPDQHKTLSKMANSCVEILVYQQSFKMKMARSIVETEKWKEQWNIQYKKSIELEGMIEKKENTIQSLHRELAYLTSENEKK
jgi:hypothetical protein